MLSFQILQFGKLIARIFFFFWGNSLVVQRLALNTFTIMGLGSIPGGGTKMLWAKQYGQNKNIVTLKKILFNSKVHQKIYMNLG